MENNFIDSTAVAFDILIPGALALDKDLSANEIRFYIVLKSMAGYKKKCWPSNEKLSKMFEVSDRSIRRWIEVLENKGWIKGHVNAKGFRTIFFPESNFLINNEIDFEKESADAECPNGGRTESEGRTLSVRGADAECPTRNSIKGNSLKEIDKKENISPLVEKESYSFSDFWKDYGKPVGKKECLDRWSKISSADKEKIKNTVHQYTKKWPESKFRKDPIRYLSKQIWLDYEGLPLTSSNDYMTCTYYDLPDEFCIEHFGKTKKELGTACYLGDIEGTVQDLLEKKLRELGRTYFANWF
jgi:hypothetical protein